MLISVRNIDESERADFNRAVGTAFGSISTASDIERFVVRSRKRAEAKRFLAAFDDGRIVGTSFSFLTPSTLPGFVDVDLAWIVAVTTLPSHRRRGIMRQVLTQQLQQVYEEGTPIAGLASATGIYRRFGFGLSASHVDVTFGKDRALLHTTEWPGKVEFTDAVDVSELAKLHEQWRRSRIGEVARNAAWWDFSGRQGRGNIYLRSEEGSIEGWASYVSSSSGWATTGRTHIEVQDFLTASSNARLALWSVVLGFDAANSLCVRTLPEDDSIFRLLQNPMSAQVTRQESPWLRLVDVVSALPLRKYNSSFSAVIGVRDGILSHNNTSFRLEIQEDQAQCARTSDVADIQLDIADLSSVFMGFTSFQQLVDAGLAQAPDREALHQLDAAFAVSPRPFCSLLIV